MKIVSAEVGIDQLERIAAALERIARCMETQLEGEAGADLLEGLQGAIDEHRKAIKAGAGEPSKEDHQLALDLGYSRAGQAVDIPAPGVGDD